MNAGEARDDERSLDLDEAVMQARSYVIERCVSHTYIDCRVISRLTSWDAARVRRFVSAEQDAVWIDQGRRPRGRPGRRR